LLPVQEDEKRGSSAAGAAVKGDNAATADAMWMGHEAEGPAKARTREELGRELRTEADPGSCGSGKDG